MFLFGKRKTGASHALGLSIARQTIESLPVAAMLCDPDDFSDVRDGLAGRFGDPDTARLDWKPQNSIPVDEDTAGTLFKLIDILDDNDDVQRVASNFDVPEEVLERLSA